MNWKEGVAAQYKVGYYPGFCLEGLRKITKSLRRDGRFLGHGTSRMRSKNANHSTKMFRKFCHK
jgi:hypothetical protein